jgi:hypothetical protein
VLGFPQHIVRHPKRHSSNLGRGQCQLCLRTSVENVCVDYLVLREIKVLGGFMCPHNQSPLENFDQILRGPQVNRDIESAPVT